MLFSREKRNGPTTSISSTGFKYFDNREPGNDYDTRKGRKLRMFEKSMGEGNNPSAVLSVQGIRWDRGRSRFLGLTQLVRNTSLRIKMVSLEVKMKRFQNYEVFSILDTGEEKIKRVARCKKWRSGCMDRLAPGRIRIEGQTGSTFGLEETRCSIRKSNCLPD